MRIINKQEKGTNDAETNPNVESSKLKIGKIAQHIFKVKKKNRVKHVQMNINKSAAGGVSGIRGIHKCTMNVQTVNIYWQKKQ